MKHSNITKRLSPKELARWIIKDFQLAKAGEILVALAEEIEIELQDGWLTEEGEMAEGSPESNAAFEGCEALAAYLNTLRHSSDTMIERVA
jgi:hypothetical protein